jgi:predicted O-methyltransferase YrrM
VRTGLRRLAFGLSTILGLSSRGFFIPYRYAGSVEPRDYPALRPLFEAAEPQFRTVMDEIARFGEDLGRIAAGDGPARFDQDWFPRLDAAAAYALVRTHRPARIVEIGSGHSTRFLARAVRDGGLSTEILCIDPAPRADLSQLGATHMPRLLAEADPALFAALKPGDVLFIDSSHVAMPGTDVDRLFLEVLPRLPAGALLHFHDVFLPEGYPPEWTWRGYNEQLLAGALLQGGGYELVFASRYVATCRPEWLSPLAYLPLPPGAFETSLWLEKRYAGAEGLQAW